MERIKDCSMARIGAGRHNKNAFETNQCPNFIILCDVPKRIQMIDPKIIACFAVSLNI